MIALTVKIQIYSSPVSPSSLAALNIALVSSLWKYNIEKFDTRKTSLEYNLCYMWQCKMITLVWRDIRFSFSFILSISTLVLGCFKFLSLTTDSIWNLQWTNRYFSKKGLFYINKNKSSTFCCKQTDPGSYKRRLWTHYSWRNLWQLSNICPSDIWLKCPLPPPLDAVGLALTELHFSWAYSFILKNKNNTFGKLMVKAFIRINYRNVSIWQKGHHRKIY